MNDSEVFSFDEGSGTFEDFGSSNGIRFWFASDLARFLGYESLATFRKAINKAMAACATLDIPVEENFVPVKKEDGRQDLKLSRFGCYLAAMNGDVKKPEVAKAQAYFAAMAETVRHYLQEVENVDRVLLRSEMSEREKSLAGVVKQAGVQGVGYALFQNAGYRGMYNMNLSDLKRVKGMSGDKSLLDYMGKTEMAANLFRITQTEERIKNEGVKGQHNLEKTAEHVGRRVRATMHELSNTYPENLPISEDIKQVRNGLKKTQKRLLDIDKAKRKLPPQ